MKRVQDEYAGLAADDRSAVDEMLQACDMMPVITTTLTRDIGREHNLEVWLD